MLKWEAGGGGAGVGWSEQKAVQKEGLAVAEEGSYTWVRDAQPLAGVGQRKT